MGASTQQVERTSNPPRLRNIDPALRTAVDEVARGDRDFWTFRRGTARAGDYALYQYPAMMVPEMPHVFLDTIMQLQQGAVRRLLDPFAGSATVLREGMMHGLDVYGLDINPLAILLAQVKAGPFTTDHLTDSFTQVLTRAREDMTTAIAVDFPKRNKWFRQEVSIGLSRLRRAIMTEPEQWIRRLLWITLAETVRLTSNSRTSTYKLHTRPASEIEASEKDPLEVFSRVAYRTVDQVGKLGRDLAESEQLYRGRYRREFQVRLQDSAQSVLPGKRSRLRYDLVVTSPPYGDNTSTVPYGQSSYLPLQWIDFRDIGDGTIDATCLRTTNEIDRRSLGGQAPREWRTLIERLSDISSTYAGLPTLLKDSPADRLRRLTVFFQDLELAVGNISRALNPNGYMVWTVGNRRVGGHEIPLDDILTEFFASHRVEAVHKVRRTIVSKRMAGRNAIASTMGREEILFFRKRE